MRTIRFTTVVPHAESLLRAAQSDNPTLPSTIDLELSDAEAHHVFHVLRAGIGSSLEIIDTVTAIALAGIVTTVEGNRFTLSIANVIPPYSLKLTLIVAVIKPALLEDIIDQCTQLGVSQFCFFFSEFGQFTFSPEKQAEKLKRYRRIAETSLKQSGNSLWPSFSFAGNLQTALTQVAASSRRLLLHPVAADANKHGISPKLSDILYSPRPASAPLESTPNHDDFQLILGPEGGLSDTEVMRATAAGFQAVSLGPKILRTETAAVVASGICALSSY